MSLSPRSEDIDEHDVGWGQTRACLIYGCFATTEHEKLILGGRLRLFSMEALS